MQEMLDKSMTAHFKSLLEAADRIVLTCHVRPDGDAIGSTLGMWHLLTSLGKRASVVIPDQAPRTLAFMPGFKEMSVFTRHEEFCRRLLGEADLIVCCDFNKPSRQDALGEVVAQQTATKVLVDHHLDPDAFCQLQFSYPDMSSTCELMFRIIAAMGFYTSLTRDAATCLLTGIVTDTRNFTVNCKNPDIYEVLMRLMDKGADKQLIVKQALETQSLTSLKLQCYAVAEKMEVLPELHGSIICLDSDELKRFAYEKGDTEGLVNLPLSVRGMVFSFFLRQDDDCIKVSARSTGTFPVSKICEDLFGGGGHLNASGAEYHGTLQQCRAILLEGLPAYAPYLPKKLEKIQ